MIYFLNEAKLSTRNKTLSGLFCLYRHRHEHRLDTDCLGLTFLSVNRLGTSLHLHPILRLNLQQARPEINSEIAIPMVKFSIFSTDEGLCCKKKKKEKTLWMM